MIRIFYIKELIGYLSSILDDQFFYLLIFSLMRSRIKTPVAVGLALGIYFGIGLFIFAITAWKFGYCKILVSFMKTFYIGYSASLGGAFMGLLRGFVDAFIG
jgi:hypothetical protein